MILSNKIEIRINISNIKHYKKLYKNIKINDIILVNVNELTKGSRYKVKMRCDKCGDEYESCFNILYKNNSLKKFICKKCKRKITIQEKYGVDNVFQCNEIKEKSKITIKEKYGVDNVSQNKEIKEKKMNTNFKHFGVKWGLSSNIIKEKSKITIKEKYGVDNVSQNKEIKEKKEKTCFKNNGVNFISQHKNFKQNINKINLIKLQKKYSNLINIEGDNFTFYCEKCEKNFEIYKKTFYGRYNLNVDACVFCNPIGSVHTSGSETNVYNFIKKNYNGEIIQNNRNIIKPYELDIYIPELKIAFEYNGLFWHNENNTSNNYHLNKTELCEKLGIQLMHIWEDDWLYKPDIIKSMILNKLSKNYNKIFARETEIKEINDNKIVKDFLNNNHIKGFISSKIKIGLFYKNELVSLITFSNLKIPKNKIEKNYELLRFCNKLNTNIIGGENKLFNYFIENYNSNKILAYIDISNCNSELYETLNFNNIGKIKPNYYYIINGIRLNKFNFRKDILIKQGYDKNKTEHEIMKDRHYYRIYDCGQLKFEYINKL